jgi:hypothetical protein
MKESMGLVWGVLAILIFAIVANISISLYAPVAVKNAIKATTDTTYKVDGTNYTVTGTGDDPQVSAQEAQDSINTARVVLNSLLALALLILVIVGVVDLIKSKHRG